MKKKLIVLGIIILIVIFIIVGFILIPAKNKANYIDKLENIRIEMINGAIEAESICNLTYKVWYNAIWEENDQETDKYTKDGIGIKHFIDFNKAIINLYSDEEIINSISNIEENQKNVKTLIQDLQNPPKELQNCYDTVLNMYDYYKNLSDLAISPTGSLEDYSNNKNNAIDGFKTEYEKLDNIMPK